jgi:hypothetical protein
VESALREGKLCLSSVIELAKVLTPENVPEILPRFFGLSRREAADVAVSIRPVAKPALREVVTVLQPQRPATALIDSIQASPSPGAAGYLVRPAEPGSVEEAPMAVGAGLPVAEAVPAATVRPCAIEPLDAERARLHITVSRRLLAKLDAAKAALSHSHPGAGSEEVLEAALDLLLEQRAKRKGIVEKPRKSGGPATSDTIPAAVKREVWKRSGGRCEWPVESEGVCGSTLRLEFDHVTPRAHGGPSTIANLRVLCRNHNVLAARQAFGDEWMNRFTRAASQPDAAAHAGGHRARTATPSARRIAR